MTETGPHDLSVVRPHGRTTGQAGTDTGMFFSMVTSHRTWSIPAMENNPKYADLIDPEGPGVTKNHTRLP